jgi:hypothetical protein
MKPWIVFLLTISTPAFAESDPWGNNYPARCENWRDYAIQVIEVGHLPVKAETSSRCGVWLQRPSGSIVYVLKSCSQPRAEVLRHEFTHECMFQQTGDPRWHD